MKLKLYSMAIVFVLLLVGCNTGDQNDNNDNIEPTRYNDNNNNDNQGRGMTPGGTTNINNRNVDNRNNRQGDNQYGVSKEAADRITDEIDEIDDAYVLTTENNAYVAAVLDNDDRENDQMNDNNQTGRNDRDINGTGTQNINNENNGFNRGEGAELTDEVKDKIADIVQSIDDDIDNVYVTTNPDFADLTNDYMNDFNDGKPVRGFFDQIGNMIERVFPQNKR